MWEIHHITKKYISGSVLLVIKLMYNSLIKSNNMFCGNTFNQNL